MKTTFLFPLLCLFFVADVAPGGCSKRSTAPAPKTSAVTAPATVLPS
jgi:hypothetical protein